MDYSLFKVVRYIIPTQPVMEQVLAILNNSYIPIDSMLLHYLEYHRKVMVQEGSYMTLDLYDEMADDLTEAVVHLNRNRPFIDMLDSSDRDEVALGWDSLKRITVDIFSRLKNVELLLGQYISSALPDAFYEYRSNPVWVRVHIGDLVVLLTPNKILTDQSFKVRK